GLNANQTGQALGAAGARDDTQRDLGKSKTGGGTGNSIMTSQRDIKPTPHHSSVHGSQHGHRQAFETGEQSAIFSFFWRPLELSNISAREECPALTHEQHAFQPCSRQAVERAIEFIPHLGSNGIDWRVIYAQRSNAFADFEL